MRHTLLIIALLWALGASGQIYIDSYRFGAAPVAGLLLDDYPNAAAAYSLRLLRTAYTGNCVEVRRVSDGATSNIGFSGGVIDTATLKTFCAGTDCFVRTWYDQSTNAYHATQTTNADQPRIVAGGVIERESGLPSINFSTDWMATDNNLGSFLAGEDVPISVFSVVKNTSGGTIFNTGGSSFTPLWQVYFAVNRFVVRKRSDASVLVQNSMNTSGTTVNSIWTAIDAGTTLTTAVNSSVIDNAISFNTGTITTNVATLGARRGTGVLTEILIGEMQEVIVYKIDQTSNRTAIETAINSFYNVY